MQDAASMSATANLLNELQMDSPYNLSTKLTPSGSKRNLSTIEDNQTPKAKVKRGRPPIIKKGFFGNRPPSSASSNNVEKPPNFELPVTHQIITDENEVQLTPRFAVPTKRGPGRPRKSLDSSSEPKKPLERTRPPSERIEVELTFFFLDFFNKIIPLSLLFLLNK